MMSAEREFLKKGSRMRLEDGSLYEITGEPLGCGGVSVIYPAERQREIGDEIVRDGISCALKECYPYSEAYHFIRNAAGEVMPFPASEEAQRFLDSAREKLLEEETVTQHIYKKASRLIPVRAVSGTVTLTMPEQESHVIRDAVVVMDSLQDKGRTLNRLLSEYGSFTAAQAFRMTHQILLAIRDVHRAGWLHLDIQDGNILIRGALEDESDLAELIDFGAARPLAENGRTEPIVDHVIFTTRGFTAPEILLRGGGTLTLGPEADIYSVGCLLLMMLTGKRCDPEALIAAAEQKRAYLPRFLLKKTACPPHLADQMQRIIAKALEKEPEKRYQSADEMLEDVRAFEHAIAPRENGLAQTKYKAFICYRHGEVDSAIAAKLQELLEHFHAPKEVSGKRHPIDRVFMDKGEISAGADFGAQIDTALRQSEWLIVVCSEKTPGSIWVKKEIQTFLKYHDRSHILAVLTGESPESSYPPELLEAASGTMEPESDAKTGGIRRRFRGRKDGIGQVKEAGLTVDLLAADARGKTMRERLKKLGGDELLRLAAPMLGTTYDALKQRRRVYQLQRMAALTAVLAVTAILFTIYSVGQNQRLQEAYDRNMLSQSEVLTNQAQTLLAAGDVYGATELALEALPSEEVDRPVWPEAENVLIEAMNLYTAEEDADLYGVTGVYRHDANVEGYFIDEINGVLISYTATSFYFWDLETCELIVTSKTKGFYDGWYVDESLLDKEHQYIYFSTANTVVCYDYKKQEYRWSYNDSDYSGVRAVYMDEETLLCVCEEKIFLLNRMTGELLSEVSYPVEDEIYYVSLLCGTYDRKLGKAAAFLKITFWDSEAEERYSWGMLYLLTYDTDTAELSLTQWETQEDAVLLQWDEAVPESVLLLSDGTLLTAWTNRLAYRDYGGETYTGENAQGLLEAISTEDQSIVWRESFVFPAEGDVSIQNAMLNRVLLTAGNKCVMLQDDGEALRTWEMSDLIVSARMISPNKAAVFTADGNQSMLEEERYWYTLRMTQNGLSLVQGANDVWYLACENQDTEDITQILRYEPAPHDENSTEFLTESTEHWSYFSHWKSDQGWLYGYASSYGEEGVFVKYLPVSSDAESRVVDIPELGDVREVYGIYDYKGEPSLLLIGSLGSSYQPTTLVAVNLEKGTYELQNLPLPESMLQGETDYYSKYALAHGGDMLCGVYYQKEDQKLHGFSVSLESGEMKEVFQIENAQSMGNVRLDLAENGSGYLAVYSYEDEDKEAYTEIYRYNLKKTGSGLQKIENYDKEYMTGLTVSEDGKHWCWWLRGTLVLCDEKGQQLSEISYDSESRSIQSVLFAPDGENLFVNYIVYGYDGGETCIYSIEDGEERCSVVTGYDEVSWKVPDADTVMLKIGSAFNAGIWEFSKTERGWSLRGKINAKCYEEVSDSFCIVWDDYSTDAWCYQKHFALFPHYTTEELVQMGRQFLGETAEENAPETADGLLSDAS